MLFKIFIEKARGRRLFGIDRFYYYYLCTAQSSLFNIHCSLHVFTVQCSLVFPCSLFSVCVTINGFLYSAEDYRIRRNLTLINLPDNGSVHINLFFVILFCVLFLFCERGVGSGGKTEILRLRKIIIFVRWGMVEWCADRVRHESIFIWNCTSSVRLHTIQ